MRIVYPAACRAIKILESILSVCPQPALQSIGRCISVPHFTNVVPLSIIKSVNWMRAALSLCFEHDSHYGFFSLFIIKNKNVASLLLLVVYQGQDIDVVKV